MIPVQAITRGAQGDAVANLQDALLYWLGRQNAMLDLDRDATVKQLIHDLTIERRDSVYKDATVRALTFFQQQLASRLPLKASGDVDDATAAALNLILGELGAAGFVRADADDEPKPQPPAFTVSGTVTLADGTPASAILVQAFDCDLRSQELLGQTQSDNSGAYKIGYTAAQFAKGESGGADLMVKALDAKGAVLAASPILFNAPPQAIVDLTIPADVRAPPTLFEKIAAALPPLLRDVKVEELEQNQQFQDLSFLAGETGFAQRDLARFVFARLSVPLGNPAEFWFALWGGAPFVYDDSQSIKTQYVALLAALPALGEGSVRKALAGAFDRQDIPAPLNKNVADWVAAFLKIAAQLVVQAGTAPSFARQALVEAGIAGADKQQKFALLLNKFGGVTPDMLAALQRDPAFAPAEIANIAASYQLADITGGDFTVVSSIKSAFGVSDPLHIRDLAARSETEWVALVTRQAAAGKINIPQGIGQPATATTFAVSMSNAELYGRTLASNFAKAYPTVAFVGGLGRALAGGGASALRHGLAIGTFLQQSPGFELLTTSVDQYLASGVGAPQSDAVRLELKAVQRVFKLAPSFDATNSLLAGGLNSAQGVYRQGRAEFVAQYAAQPGFTAASASLAWDRAANIHAAALTVVGEIIALDPGGLPAAMQNAGAQITDFPDWNNLFQAGDLCDCEDCRSVLSPAAYFADLLMFLKDRRNKNNSGSVKDVLFNRRPDLGFLELNCDNALTPLPYIDVVCEVLEAVIAQGASDVPLPGFTAMPSSNAEAAVKTALTNANLDPGADFTLAQVTASDPNRWVVHGDAATYLLWKTGAAPFKARILPNTKASAEELRAYPAYVDPAPYVALRGAVYPFNLPFDLFAEEVRAAFNKCNLQRWDLMRTLQTPGRPLAPTAGDIAAEYFGIGVSAGPMDEKRLILAADTSPGGTATQAAWGETGNATWLTKLANVKNFLDKSGLEFEELLALLDLKFVNPLNSSGTAREIVLQRPDPSCDTDKMTLAGLNAADLDRIHRFVRLWRKLGWKMWEVDFVIRQQAVGGGALNEPFLINLYWLSRLRTRLGDKTGIEQMCALLGDLNTETSFTEAYKKRTDGLYQSLFLNKRLVQPIDDAYQVDSVTTGTPLQIAAHLTVLMGALRISETDLDVFGALTKASDNLPYIDGTLTLPNISFLWRHVWLSRQLKLKPAEWVTMLRLGQQDVAKFATPEAAFKFVERLDQVKAAGLAPDQLDWLLCADLDAKAATNVTATARFLASLRKALQAIKAQYDPAQYPILSPPTDTANLSALLTSLLLQLGRDAAAAQSFVDTLAGTLVQEAAVDGLPANFAFPSTITGTPNNIAIVYESTLVFAGNMTVAQQSTLLTDPTLTTVTGLVSYQQAIAQLFASPGQPATVQWPPGFAFPAAITASIPIQHKAVLRLTGQISATQKSALLLLSAVPAYQQAIADFRDLPLLAVKFFAPAFSAPLNTLPPAVDFHTLTDADLAARISYDGEQKLLTVSGILTGDEKQALDLLSTDASYRAAVQSLFDQPRAPAVAGAPGIWLLEADLQGTPAVNFAAAIGRALTYLTTSLSQGLVVQQAAAQLGLSEALTRYVLTQHPVMPGLATLLDYLTQTFAITANALEYTPVPPHNVFDGWFWADRCATLLKKWKLSVADLQKLDDPARLGGLPPAAQLLGLGALPFSNPPAIASLDRYLRTSRLLAFRDSLPESDIAFLDVLGGISAGGYNTLAAFAADVETLTDSWAAADVAKLIDTVNGYGTAFPAMSNDFLLAENWERLRRAFYFLDSLNASAVRVLTFSVATMGQAETKTLKELLRSKFGAESWLALSAGIQDALRERKRDSLAAYILTLPAPIDAPSGKWVNSNDLYAYYLLDIEMCSCMLTSRLVQGTGSIQLFVQRCFMGLEPAVLVKADGDTGDSAWKWWTWMSKFQVWVANRKVFLWPENWIEPELKSDTSSFFNDFKKELQQNEIDSDNVETAFASYLEKLDGVARLEIAGFYQQDDGDDTILHVFGRTKGTEPHVYYYRRFDYRQWTPWEKVELDIQGDYLIPAVLNGRLFLFWPVFTEVPDEATNGAIVRTPHADQDNPPLQRTQKKLRLQMAVSDYRRDKWTPRRISKDFNESAIYEADIVRNHYSFMALDRTDLDGRFAIVYSGFSEAVTTKDPFVAGLSGAFELAGCDGAPAAASFSYRLGYAILPERTTDEDYSVFMKWVERSSRLIDSQNSLDDFTLQVFGGGDYGDTSIVPLLMRTPGLYQMSSAWQFSYMDRVWMQGRAAFGPLTRNQAAPLGSWLPFFYSDDKRTFFALPASSDINVYPTNEPRTASFYPDFKRQLRGMEEFYAAQIATSFEHYTPPRSGTPERQQLETLLAAQFPQDTPPYSDDRFIARAQQYVLRWMQYYLSQLSLAQFQQSQYQFRNFYHPFVCDFLRLVENPLKGIPALMARDNQLKDSGFSFKQTYLPTRSVINPLTDIFYPSEIVDFSPDGAYSSYNWELFFHAPLLIANSLSQNQKFAEARDWYHFIFNPIGVESAILGGSPMSKYWITKPFFETTDAQYIQQRIYNILGMLNGNAELESQVRDWRDHPFDPHRIANYRTTAYQKNVVMKYLDNLIAWGDSLFRQDSMESINQATQLYVMAAEILGPRPRKIPPAAKPPLSSYNEMESSFDAFSNAMVQVENLIPQMSGSGSGSGGAPLPMLYFCIPQNEILLGYWDTVADRLYKINHCMNIEGVVRQLALFEPPIDPGALVKAVAGGVDIASALADLNAPLPLYRFNVLLQKANELCGDVKALGGALLSALEKKDGEALNLLRQGQEIRVLEATKAVRETQVDEAKQNLEGSRRSKLTVEERRNFYRDVQKVSNWEKASMDAHGVGIISETVATVMNATAGVAHLAPSFTLGAAGFGGTPTVLTVYGGSNFANSAFNWAAFFGGLGGLAHSAANLMSTQAGNERRWDEWKLQERMADKELDQIDSQIAAAELRVTIAQKELDNLLLQIDNAKAVDAFMRSKYTNEELYQWQVGQISGVYFQSYKLAYDLAKRAERCFRFELGLQDSSYISFGYWDSLKKGLLAGEALQYDLRRLDAAYLDKNRRELELTKHVSLQLLDPLALVRLRETGSCFFNLPEELFDLDYPGHYFRRIKSVSLTLPCVTGPYTTVSCTVRLLKNAVRIDTLNGDNGYPRNTGDGGSPADDVRFVENNIQVQAIAASSAQNDSGVFELNFRDERYLPFEGAGAISHWALELFNDPSRSDFGRALRQFDYETISDAVLQIKYTAREDAGPFRARVIDHLNDYYYQQDATTALRLFDMRRDFPSQWSRFTDPAVTSGNTLAFSLFPDLFRAIDAGKTLKIDTVWIMGRCNELSAPPYGINFKVPSLLLTQPMSLTHPDSTYGSLFYDKADLSVSSLTIGPGSSPVACEIVLANSTPIAAFEDVLVAIGYRWV